MKIAQKLKEAYHDIRSIRDIRKDLNSIRMSLGRIEGRQLGTLENGMEYQVFSQWGEDGIIQWLIRHIPIKEKRFIEFGVENYTESNTRYLLAGNNWSGLVIDGSEENIRYVKRDSLYWRHNLKAVAAFITAENINELIQEHFAGGGGCGILSIDVDGNDYWIWKAVDCITPDIVICEYNHRFGCQRAVTIPYRPDFYRQKAHESMIYYGASIAALVKLGESKGYSLVEGNRNGCNLFFVRKELLNEIVHKKEIEECFYHGQFRESRDREGNLAFLQMEEEQNLLKDLPLIEV